MKSVISHKREAKFALRPFRKIWVELKHKRGGSSKRSKKRLRAKKQKDTNKKMDNNEDNPMEPEIPMAEAPDIPAPIPAVPEEHPVVGEIPNFPESPEYHAPQSPDVVIIPEQHNRG